MDCLSSTFHKPSPNRSVFKRKVGRDRNFFFFGELSVCTVFFLLLLLELMTNGTLCSQFLFYFSIHAPVSNKSIFTDSSFPRLKSIQYGKLGRFLYRYYFFFPGKRLYCISEFCPLLHLSCTTGSLLYKRLNTIISIKLKACMTAGYIVINISTTG